MDLIEKTGMYSRMSKKTDTVAVENNCVSQTKISMKFEIAKFKKLSKSVAKIKPHNKAIMNNMMIVSAVSSFNGFENRSEGEKSQSQLDNQNFINTVNLKNNIN